MSILKKLLGYIHPVFNKNPDSFLAFRVRYKTDDFRWSIADRTLSGFAGSSLLFVVDLKLHTISSLISYLWTVPGVVSVSSSASPSLLENSAATLVDGENSQAESNGDALYAYSSLLWMFLDVVASALELARLDVAAMIDQMTVKTADDYWLDEWGGYFGVPRVPSEADSDYSARIIAEVIRPRGNNKAIEAALLQYFGQAVSVTDIVKYKNQSNVSNGSFLFNGSHHYDGTQEPIYGLFQVVIGYDILSGGDQSAFSASVRAIVEKFRDAGTQLDSLSLAGSSISDSQSVAPVDASIPLTVTRLAYFNGAFAHGGEASYAGTSVSIESV